MLADPRTCMLVPGADRLALGEQMLTAQPAAEEASQGKNPTALQRVPTWPRSDSVFATSEFTELPAGATIRFRSPVTGASTL